MNFIDFGAFQIFKQMLSHDKIIFHMLFGAFHVTSRISIFASIGEYKTMSIRKALKNVITGDTLFKKKSKNNYKMLMKFIFSHSELPWQQNVSRLSIQYQIEQDEKKKQEQEHRDRIKFVREKKMREAAEKKEAERRAAAAKKTWSVWLMSYWTNMEYNHSKTPALDDLNNTGSPFDDFINADNRVPVPSAGPTGRSTAGRVSTGRTSTGRTSTGDGSDFKKSRVSKRERMSTNYIW